MCRVVSRKNPTQYGEAGDALTRERADKELVAKFVEEHLLTDEDSIYALVRQNPTLGQKIKNLLDSLLAKLGNKNAREREFLRRARDLYAKALQETKGLDQQTSRTQQTRNQLQEDLAAGRITEAEFDEAMDALAEDEAMEDRSMLYEQRRENEGEQEQHSIVRTRHMTWKEQVREYFKENGKIRSSDSLYLGESNTNGVRNAPRYVPTSVITKALRQPKGSRSAHSLSETDVFKLEDGINSAPAVILNPKRNALVYVTENRNKVGEPIVATFDLNNKLVGETAHRCTSIHGRSSISALLEGIDSDATVFVTNENKLNDLLSGNQILKSLELLANVEFVDDSIQEDDNVVKEQKSIVRQKPDADQIANDLRQMLNRGASAAELRRYVDGLSNTVQKNTISRDVTPSERILRTAHRQGLSVQEYLQQNWELYDVDGELNTDARKALELEQSREQHSFEAVEPGTETAAEEVEPTAVQQLPTKARARLENAERKLTNDLSSALGVPWNAKREFLRPIVREISEEYLRTGTVSQETADRLFETAYENGIVVDSVYLELMQMAHCQFHCHFLISKIVFC